MRRSAAILATLAALALAACAGHSPPEWIRGQSSAYPVEECLLGVGFDRDRDRAEERARAELAKTFQVAMPFRKSSSESHWLTRLGKSAAKEYTQDDWTEWATTTDKFLEEVRIAEVWYDEKTDIYFALTVLDRGRLSLGLRNALAEIDQDVEGLIRRAEMSPSAIRRLSSYLQALRSLDRRNGLAADLRVADPAEGGAESQLSMADISARADQAASEIRIGVDLQGDRQGIVEGALVRSLAGLGMQLAPAFERDVLVRGMVTVEQYHTAGAWQWIAAAAQVEFVAGDGAVMETLRASVREGSQVAMRSETLARERLGRKLADLLIRRIGLMGGADK